MIESFAVENASEIVEDIGDAASDIADDLVDLIDDLEISEDISDAADDFFSQLEDSIDIEKPNIVIENEAVAEFWRELEDEVFNEDDDLENEKINEYKQSSNHLVDTNANENLDIDHSLKVKDLEQEKLNDQPKDNIDDEDSDTDVKDDENIQKFIDGETGFESVLKEYAKIYADIVLSNKPWSWSDNIPGGNDLSQKQKKQIKEKAIDEGLLKPVPIKEIDGYKFADFEAAGLVKETVYLPEDMWNLSDKEQFDWLNSQIGGKQDGYTWHHSDVPGKMELVPFGMHNITDHNGGRSPGMWADSPRN